MSDPVDTSSPLKKGRTLSRCRYASPHSDGGMAVERLTDDLLVEILARLPVKSLCRFKCVSNHWLALIHHPEHRKKLPQTPAGFFYGSANTGDWLLKSPVRFADFPGRCSPPIDTSCAFLPNHRRVHLLDCCNGLLLCRWYVSAQGDEFHYVVCNPATEKWTVLPDFGKPTSEVATTRLGFDPAVSSHFYVFELINEHDQLWDPDIVGVAVYSSETGGWVYKEKKWNADIRIINRQSASVFLNGYLHFEADCGGISPCLAVVDTKGETWMNIDVPDADALLDGFIQRSQGRLHYANFQQDEDGFTIRLVVYVLENYQSKEWILKHSVDTSYIFGETDSHFRLDKDFEWIAIHPECNMIFFNVGWFITFTCYNMDSGQVKLISGPVDGKPPYMPYVPLYAELQPLHI
ncbi:unnamed protein product [Triticum turgidum subsp. durum]|uniref:F-box domain-containing protein n=1 Tax=Triticum turgidum subsp. durum TaxID=4567 RepID=A0A9R1AA75_TRITD|nr:unnamed protein product [Triticum turgidum subsp. durum]